MDRAKELLRRGVDPRDIMENTFQVQFQTNAQLKSFYEPFFSAKGRYRVSFNDVIVLYSSLSGYYLGKYK